MNILEKLLNQDPDTLEEVCEATGISIERLEELANGVPNLDEYEVRELCQNLSVGVEAYYDGIDPAALDEDHFDEDA